MKPFVLVIIATLLVVAQDNAEDVVLVNGRVIDGSGKPRVAANVRVREGKIADIGPFKPASGETILDVKGMIVAPGFIDLRSLSPSTIQKDPVATPLIVQGVTTAVLGSDGTGVYSVEDFMLPFDEKPPGLNIAMLVGHGTVRRQIMGADYKRSATPDEIERMTQLVSDAMKQGAFGLASDLQQEPASFGTPDELMTLTKMAARFGGILMIRLRDERAALAASVREAVALAREAKIPVQVQAESKAAVAQIDKSRAQRVDIGADSYSFSELTRDKGAALERAIQRMSGTPASRLGLRDRGILKKGAPADIVVFNPLALASGVQHVFVNGTMVVKDGRATEARSGQALR
jgi:N-acyl-D-aspartate/D-glutamate deacylase